MHHFIQHADKNEDFQQPPHPADPEKAAVTWQTVLENAEQAADGAVDTLKIAHGDPAVRAWLDGVFGCSPFLGFCAGRDPAFLADLLTNGPDATFAAIMETLTTAPTNETESQLAARLRQLKRKVSLTVGLADITGAWPLAAITNALSDFAASALSQVMRHLLAQAHDQGVMTLPDPAHPETECGIIVLGMGKLGARELNYSSDIDLIVLFDPDKINTERPDKLQQALVRLTRSMVRLMDERTADGYVFRTDLRLRPDPGSTPPIVSVPAAELYYEGTGQNWERAAMIKARPVAGDLAAGDAFLTFLSPFIWRRNLDFAAIQDIHSIKRQINAHKGGSTLQVAGHNVKLGRGGIREIEFYAQTQQLIWGGRVPDVRTPPTEAALAALVALEQVDKTVADELVAAYRYLRRVEHRIQMIADEQTHNVPTTDEGIAQLAAFLGYADADAFAGELLASLRTVESHYADLFEDSPSLSLGDDIGGNLVFTGTDPDPDTQETLKRLGFSKPESVDAAVRGWHHGRYRSTRSERTRGILTELMPVLLRALGQTADPDTAFKNFDVFLSRLPAGVQLFAMFHSHPQLLDLIAEIMGGAPRLSDQLAGNANLLESVLAPDFFDPPPGARAMAHEVGELLERSQDMQMTLEDIQRWANDRRFQVGVQALQGILSPGLCAHALSNIADTALATLQHAITEDFATTHGRVPGGDMVIVGLGKLGSRELTPESDLDMIFVYDVPAEVSASDGDKPLVPSQYFARLSQRLIGAVSAQTAEGALYEVDMRLRPSGSAGPIATSLESFTRYHAESAWTWEHMALTRARVIAGPAALAEKVEGVIIETLSRPRVSDKLLRDVADMRARMDKDKHTDFVWDVKHVRGGLVDAEFVIQYLLLRHAHDRPAILAPGMRDALDNLEVAGLIDKTQAAQLSHGLAFWQALQMMLRLTIPRDLRKDRQHDLPEGLRRALVTMTKSDNFEALCQHMLDIRQQVFDIFNAIVQKPADALGSVDGADLNR